MSRDDPLHKVIIDGVQVTCVPTEPDFSLGKYNLKDVPEVECVNGGSIECPEMHGTRYLVNRAEAPQGSTKMASNAEYKIVKDGEEPPFSAKQLNILQKINEAGLQDPRLTRDIKAEDMDAFLTYAQYGLDCSPMFEHYEQVRGNCKTYLGALYVGCNPDDEGIFKIISTMSHLGMFAEAQLDEVKQVYAYMYLYNYDGPVDGLPANLLSTLKTHFLAQHPEIINVSDEEMRFWWELIPVMEYKNMGSIVNDVAYYYYGYSK